MRTFQKIGTDAEYFVANAAGVGSAIGLIGGSKEEPKIIPYGNLQEDNVLAEFAIDPVETKSDWMSSIRIVSGHLRGLMRSKDYTVICKASHLYEKADLLSYGPMAMEMGCMPDFNVYTNKTNPKPTGQTRLRTAAGHVHFSYENPDEATTKKIIKCLDYMLGVWSVIEDRDTHRRELYGKAGSCRLKEYGGEYRTLGNFWLITDDRLEYVYDTTKACVEHVDKLLPRFESLLSATQLQAIINNYDVSRATVLYEQISDIYQEVICD